MSSGFFRLRGEAMRRQLPILLLPLLFCPAAGKAREPDWPRVQEEALQRLAHYLAIDTTNPPGNELRAARFFEEWFRAEGIPVEVYEFVPGRANLIARLKGDGSRRPIILLNHMDVVSSDPQRWRVPPFSGAMVEGYVYGRGALDTKGLGLLQAMVLVLLKRQGVPLRRDILFVATADEEVALAGAEWLLARQREQLASAEYVLNEGGSNLVENGHILFFGVDNAEKAPFWLRVRARGAPGHGSRPLRDSAANRLVRAMARVTEWETPIQVLPDVEKFFRDVADQQPPERRVQFRDVRGALAGAKFRDWVTSDVQYNYLLRNTVSLTVLRGANQTNVIPGEAVAHLDVRLLPGEDPNEFLKELRAVMADDTLEVEPLQTFRRANTSPTDNELFRVLEAVVRRHHPGAVVTTRLLSGYTESQLFRELGIASYGFSPFLLDRAEEATVHGDNERLSVENVRRGLRLYYEVVERLVRE
jgi:acetylornithine deacetylase/succinyl-diaminopimelate desuccinylase-like protein